jgi:hypothetical protein
MTVMLRLCASVLAAGITSLLLAGCRQYAPIKEISFELILAPDRNLGKLDMAYGDSSHLVRITDLANLRCTGANEYKEYNSKATVVIRNDKNLQIGKAFLGEGEVMDVAKSKSGVPLFRGCRFKVDIPLAGPSRVYRVDIANGKHKDYVHISRLVSADRKIMIDLD